MPINTLTTSAQARTAEHFRHLASTGREADLRDLLNATPDLDLDAVDDLGCTALLLAAGEGHLGVVNVLLDADASVSRPALDGETPLHAAARQGHDRIVERLVRAGANVNARDADSSTPLHAAAWNANADTVERLISLGADPTAQDADGDTPVAVARMRDVVIRGSDRPRTIALLDAAMTPEAREAETLRAASQERSDPRVRPGF